MKKSPTQEQDASTHAHVIQRLRELLGDRIFAKHPNLCWQVKQGNIDEGTILVMSGIEIPDQSISWFEKKLAGEVQFKFVQMPSGHKQLCILDIDKTVTLRHLERLNQTMSPQNRHYVDRMFTQKPTGEALDTILSQAADAFTQQIEGEILLEEGIPLTNAMRTECKNRIIQTLKLQHSSGTMHHKDSPESIMAVFQPVKASIIADYKRSQGGNCPSTKRI